MAATTQYPLNAVVRIDFRQQGAPYQASGFLISPDEVVTAAHVLYDATYAVASNDIVVTPGAGPNSAPYGTALGTVTHYNRVNDKYDLISLQQSQIDFGVIHLDHAFNQITPLSLKPDYHGGQVTVTGYPGYAAGVQTTVNEPMAQDPNYTLLDGQATGQGSSGGPVYVTEDGQARVVALVSSGNFYTGQGHFTQITSAAAAQIAAWVAQDDHVAATPTPTPTPAPAPAPAPAPTVSVTLVDAAYYRSVNGDVAAAGADPATHYDTFGWHEGRNPDAYFSTVGYLAFNSDVRAAGVDPAVHYDQSGWREGRDPGPDFNTRLYLLRNPDVARAGIDPLAHYLQYGHAEGRASGPALGPAASIGGGFSPEFYLMANPDVARAGIDPLTHYRTYGWHELRLPDPFFDVGYYLRNNPDVAAAHIDPLLHYDQYGWREGRNPSAAFNTRDYLTHAPDVAAAGIDPLTHYLQYGIYEGRPIA